MIVSLVVATDHARAIGVDGGMPWHLPADLAWFKRNTVGKPIVMGRRTHASIGRALPERTNIVLTRSPDYDAPGCVVVPSLDAALEAAANTGADEVCVIGGASLYEACLPRADKLILTVVHARVPRADTWFPPLSLDHWHVADVVHREADARNAYDTSYYTLERVACSDADARHDRPLSGAADHSAPPDLPAALRRFAPPLSE